MYSLFYVGEFALSGYMKSQESCKRSAENLHPVFEVFFHSLKVGLWYANQHSQNIRSDIF
jgi:hypothetical protein